MTPLRTIITDGRLLFLGVVVTAAVVFCLVYSPVVTAALLVFGVGTAVVVATWSRLVWFYIPLFFLGYPCYSWALGKVSGGIPPTAVLFVFPLLHLFSIVRKGPAMVDRPPWKLLAIIGLLVGYLCFSLLWSGNRSYGTWKIGVFVVCSVSPFLMMQFSRFDRGAFRQFGIALLTICLVIFLEVLLLGGTEYSRAKLFGVNTIWISRIAVIGMYVAITNMPSFTGALGLVARILCIATGLWLVVKSGSRGPVISLIAALSLGYLSSLLLQERFSSKVKYALIAPAIVLLFISPMIIFPSGEFRYANILDETYDYEYDQSATGRMDHVQYSWEKFKAHPILGVGTGGYTESTRDYPHNILLEFSAEGGVVGLSLFLILIVSIVRRLDRKHHEMISLLTLPLLFTMVSGDIAANAEWMVAAGFTLQASRFYFRERAVGPSLQANLVLNLNALPPGLAQPPAPLPRR